MLKQMLKSLIAEGRLTGENLAFDGASLTSISIPEWRPDGWSTETSKYGARRHRLIEQKLHEMSRGDWADRRVLEEKAKRWFAFDPRIESVRAEDPAAAALAQSAYSIHVTALMLGGNANPFDFSLPASEGETPEGASRYFPKEHAVVVGRNESWPETWPETYVKLLTDLAATWREWGPDGWVFGFRPERPWRS